MGVGTSIISVINYDVGIIKVIAYSGDSCLGDIANKIVEYYREKIETTHYIC